MRVALLVIPALLLAGCATTSGPSSTPWLSGLWIGMEEGVEYPLACASGLPIRYLAGGRYEIFEERGTWRLDGDRLTETATEATGAGDEGTPEIGRPYVSRIARDGDGAFVKTYADGAQTRFRRCPE
ncbi:hypothetical protein RCO27_09365 [Sphingosinicella sp. LHD-64]|uniref:hypothetical protein n=1 Tax=Sphingosinicella sp. LHD-64 TaxID=3072139 RepID=UPI00280CD321|nr:hypothetical protein [Sphingosinicella sp. LHD-64]MDQ8756437.1 hypothetical protein [Sphingosinicella sp. LHD-64]